MRRWAALALLVGFLVATPVDPPVAVAAPPSGGALTDIASCVRERHSLAALIVVDVSGSLGRTDPAKSRVNAGLIAIDRLADLVDPARTGAEPVAVQIALAGFADTFSAGPWRDLATSRDAIETDFRGFGDRFDGTATDYVEALAGASEVLLGQAKERTCQALIWFTDGEFRPNGDLPSDDDLSDLCDAGGAVDKLRSTGATMLSVALTTALEADAENLLRQVTGVSEGCGTPSAKAKGYYFPASDGAALVDAFADLLHVGAPVLCERGRPECVFQLEPQMKNFYVLVHTGGPGRSVTLRPPGGQAGFSLSRPQEVAATEVAGATAKWEWFTDETVVLKGELPPGKAGLWAGEWRVEGLDGLTGRVYLTGALDQRLVDEPSFVRGERWRLRTEIVAEGKPVDQDLLGPIDPKTVITVADGADALEFVPKHDPNRPAEAELVFDPPARWHAARVTITVELRVLTPGGIDISPAPLVRAVPVVTPLTVVPSTLELPDRRRGEPLRGTFTVKAGSTPGCVWIDDDHTTVVSRQVELQAVAEQDSRERCKPIAAGREEPVSFTLDVTQGCGCLVRGTLPVVLEVSGNSIPLDVEFTFVSTLDQSRRAQAITALGFLTFLPLLALLLINRQVIGKLRLPRSVRCATVAVTVVPNGVDWGSRQNWPLPDDVISSSPKRRALEIGRVTFRARTSWWNPFALPRAIATTTGGRVVATPEAGPGHVVDDLPLDLTGQVAVAADGDRNRDGFLAEVVVVLGDTPLSRVHACRVRDDVEAAARLLRPQPRPNDTDF